MACVWIAGHVRHLFLVAPRIDINCGRGAVRGRGDRDAGIGGGRRNAGAKGLRKLIAGDQGAELINHVRRDRVGDRDRTDRGGGA